MLYIQKNVNKHISAI